MKRDNGFVEVKGSQIYFETAGSGPSLVLVHGFSLDRRMWDPQFEMLAARFSVLRYDCRGFGLSFLPTKETYTHGEDLRALLAHLKIERAIVMGLSMGGQIALELATSHHGVVQKLILVDPFLSDFSFSDEWRKMRMRMAEKGAAGDVNAAKEV